MATTTSPSSGSLDRPVNKQSIYWIIAAAVVLLIALSYAVSRNRSMDSTTSAVERTLPGATSQDTSTSGVNDPTMRNTTDPTMSGGAAMENMDPMATDPAVTDPIANDPAVNDSENPTNSPSTNGNSN